MAGDNWLISDKLWAKMEPLLPEHKTNHPLGRHRKRVESCRNERHFLGT